VSREEPPWSLQLPADRDEAGIETITAALSGREGQMYTLLEDEKSRRKRSTLAVSEALAEQQGEP